MGEADSPHLPSAARESPPCLPAGRRGLRPAREGWHVHVATTGDRALAAASPEGTAALRDNTGHPWLPHGPLAARPRSQGQLSRRKRSHFLLRDSQRRRDFSTSNEFFLHFVPLFLCFLLINIKMHPVPSCSPACPQPSVVSLPVRLEAPEKPLPKPGPAG